MLGSIHPRGLGPVLSSLGSPEWGQPHCVTHCRAPGGFTPPIPDRSSPGGLRTPHPNLPARGSRTHRPSHGSVVPVHGPEPGRGPGAGPGGAVGEGGPELEAVAQVVPAAAPAGAGRGGLGGAGAAGAQRELSGGAGAGDALGHGRRCQGVHEGGFPRSCGENRDISFLPAQPDSPLAHLAVQEFLYFVLQQDKPEPSQLLCFNLCPLYYTACIPTSSPAFFFFFPSFLKWKLLSVTFPRWNLGRISTT